jgi:hypothetical protein
MNRKLSFGISIALLCIIGIGVYLWHDITTFKKSLSSDPKIEGKQERTDRVTATATETTPVETPEQVDREISEIIEHLEALHAPEPAVQDGEDPTVQPADPEAAAWARLEYISQNPQEWGDLSPQATELMAQLTPTWAISTEGEGEKAIHLLKKLGKLRDPRAAELFVNYMSRVKGKRIRNTLMAIGPPAVLPLIPILANQDSTNRGTAARILGAIGSEHRQDLGGAVEYILLPKLEKLATSDPEPRVRQYASEAVSQLR